jgi:hypothetical protein
MANPYIKYYKAEFNGIFHTRERASLPFHQFNEIEWEQLKITHVESLESYDAWELQTSNSWYRKKLKPYKNLFFSRQWVYRWPKLLTQKDFPWIQTVKWQFPVWRKRTHLIIPLNEEFQLQEELHEVVLKRIELVDHGKEWFGGLREAKGIIYFQIHLPPEKPKVPATTPVQATTVETNVVPESPKPTQTATNIWSINQDLNASAAIAPVQQPLTMSQKGNRKWRWFMLLWLVFTLWKLPALFVPSLIIFAAIAFYRYFRKACLGLLASLFIFGLAGFLLIQWLPKSQDDKRTTDKKEGSIKILPPKKTDGSDLLNEKEVSWWDFYRNFFRVNYSTSSLSFFDSEQFHAQAVQGITTNSSVEFFTQLYQKLESNDASKLDSLVELFKNRIEEKQLSPIKSAEMVTTFIQEIPYFLVHDLDCKTAVSTSNSDFMTQYHSENKPCLPNVPGGVQSPYEFAHNLKGDCDTRSLLAYTILKKLGISASVWVSETYGHSILGVGLPVGAGSYKEINGVKHYATELTAKGFRLGMISPENQNMSNWDITLFYNR